MNDLYNKLRNGMETGKSQLIMITGKIGSGKSMVALSIANEVSNGPFTLDNIAMASCEEIERLKGRISPGNVYILDDIGVEGFDINDNIEKSIKETLKAFDLPGVLLIITVSEGSVIEKLVSPLSDVKIYAGKQDFRSDTLNMFAEMSISNPPSEQINEYMVMRKKINEVLVKKVIEEFIKSNNCVF